MTALERAARAAYDCEHGLDTAHYTGFDAHFENGKIWWMETVRAVLMSVREPGEAAVMAGCKEIEDAEMGPEPWTGPYDIWKPAARLSFTAMIDAILNDGANDGQA